MKHFATLFTIVLFANFSFGQSENYTALWQEVAKYEDKGLPKSALEVISKISALAKKENNAAQVVKCLIYESKYALTLEEDAQLSIIENFKSEITKSQAPTKNLLENLMATMYWQYFQSNRWKFYNRTATAEKDSDDFRTWDLETLFNEIHKLYQNSLDHAPILQQTPLANYDELLMKGEFSKRYRPTLFDLLSYNALQFYETSESSINRPSYQFNIENPELLTEAKKFSSLNIQTKDSLSLQLNAIKIYQQLIAFHLKDKEPFALVDADIKRLNFVYQNAVFENKDTFLEATLKASADLYKTDVSGLYHFEMASLYYKQGKKFDIDTNTEVQWQLKKALEICTTISHDFPNSIASGKAEILKTQILKPELQITAEQFLPIQKQSFVLLRYANIQNLDFKIFKISNAQLELFNKIYKKEEQYQFLLNLTATESWQVTLPTKNDYQNHSTEVVMPALNNGHYILFTQQANNSETFGFTTIQVSDMALLSKSNNISETLQIINRNNGKPLPGVSLEISYQEKYNGPFINKSFVTDQNGEVSIQKSKSRYLNLSVTTKLNNETAHFGGLYINQQNSSKENEIEYKAFLFTDRSIYRPGQVVYFKGIVIKNNNGKSEIVTNQKVEVILYDANSQDLKTLELKTNEFGSISGEFILPQSGLTGEFEIEIEADNIELFNNVYISVEEYKRPKFEAKFNPVTESYRINDSISLKGNAMAYAGSNITNASVAYRVVRTVQYPRWYSWKRMPIYSQSQEITYGDTKTDAEGNFEIKFKAIPDESVDKKGNPIFTYEITADITDLNGETRSATTTVNVGYHAMTATIRIASQLDKNDNDHQITINTRNLNGEFVAAAGTIKIYKLNASGQVLRSRPWTAPDLPMLDETTFKKLFPHDAYNNEHNPKNWKLGKLVFKSDFNTANAKEIKLGNLKKWESGTYIVLLESEDKFNQVVKDETQMTLYSDDDKTVSDQTLFSANFDKSSYQPKDVAVISFGSATNLTVTVDVEKNEKIVNTYIIPLDNHKKSIVIPIHADDVGGFTVHYSYAVFNSFESGTLNISVPYPKSDLEIETSVFRDKLQPGTDETWQFKIKGPEGEKVSAELLASMYDASLDQFKMHQWQFRPIQNPVYYSYSKRNNIGSFGNKSFMVYLPRVGTAYPHQQYDQINWFGFYFGINRNNMNYRVKGNESMIMAVQDVASPEIDDNETFLDQVVVTGNEIVDNDSIPENVNSFEADVQNENFENIKIRKNLQETAFFFPHLQTDAEGNISFSFTTPEALTRWKLQLLAHTKTLKNSTKTLETVTQKELMVIPNAPRFLRQGDDINISTKIANLTDKTLTGQAVLQLVDAVTGKDITQSLIKSITNSLPLGEVSEGQSGLFSVEASGNTEITWSLRIPDNIDAVQYTVIAKSGEFSDAEQNALPVLSNRMLVTEALPMWVRSNETRTFTLDKLKNNTSTTLKHHQLTLEITSNPAWYALQALPYLMEYPYDCNEQIFSRFYANALASHIANSNPRIKEVFELWRNSDALISNLEKNQELKSILIEETPWLRDAQSESEQKKRIALLFDLNKMNSELQKAQRQLQNNQMSNGAWTWFEGGKPNRYITQHVITGFGHLKKLSVTENSLEEATITKAINYLDTEFVEEYKNLTKYSSKVDLSKDHLSAMQLHYLYMRSFFPEVAKSQEVQRITNYYLTQINNYWLNRPLYAKGLMAVISHRNDNANQAQKILKSLKETAIVSDELGMYWKENTASWHWYQAPIETQSLIIEAFSEIDNISKNNGTTIDNLKIWLLKHKQTNSWKTTKATTKAIYALLLQGSDWLSITEAVEIMVGSQKIEPSKLEHVKVEAGTGYFKTTWNASEIAPKMSEVTLAKKGEGIAWGSLYWQYFEDLDKITKAETPLKLNKKLFLKSNTDKGEVITEIDDSTSLKVGDLVRVRIELRSDRDMEFIHMKDMRAAGLEPVNVLSQYKWQDGLGYYEATKDASTNFFFDFLPKGIYVFEYDLRVNNSGNMSNGITTIQSMYAPEFSSHSEGIRIKVNP
ncbi:alpha-2-macroglobulin family protein [Paucihalobacter sp.]|uniref:alpha-2-macroglobulin family protein n=1 Tax=Paucihalobacter sp. TaxID=2850405 RepID=UPI003D160DF9